MTAIRVPDVSSPKVAPPKVTAATKIRRLEAEVKSLTTVNAALKKALLDLDVLAWSVEDMIKAASKGEEVGHNG